MAADFLDASIIGNLEDTIGDAPIYRRNYFEAVDTVISEFSWNGTTARALLYPAEIEAALGQSDMRYCYPWPIHCLAPLEINGRPIEDIRWSNEIIDQVDGHGNITGSRRVIWCDAPGPIALKYSRRIRPADMSPHLAKAIALELAIRCCTSLTNSTSKMQELQIMYAEATRGTSRRVGGFQIDSRQNRPEPARQLPSRAEIARAGGL